MDNISFPSQEAKELFFKMLKDYPALGYFSTQYQGMESLKQMFCKAWNGGYDEAADFFDDDWRG